MSSSPNSLAGFRPFDDGIRSLTATIHRGRPKTKSGLIDFAGSIDD